MSKILIGVLTAHHPSRWHYREIQREKCFKDSPLDHVYVFGRPSRIHFTGPDLCPLGEGQDSIFADCDDRKEFMVLKNQALFKYALDKGYDYCFRCCDDTWVYPDRIAKANLEPFDYAGRVPCKINLGGTFKVWMRYFDYMHGGCGIWLSWKAMEKLVADEWDPDRLRDWPEMVDVGMGYGMPMSRVYWDDHWIGEVLKGNVAWDDLRRQDSVKLYSENGIRVLEDDAVFWDDDPSLPLAIHDPGRVKCRQPMAVPLGGGNDYH